MTEKKYIPYIDGLRAIAIAAVVMIHCAIGTNADLNDAGIYIDRLIHSCCDFAVPAFVMITGSTMLDREESIKRNMKRILKLAIALFIFGSVAAFAEEFFTSRDFSYSALRMIPRVIKGDTWSFAWFLYMMIGIYFMLPLFRIFVKHADNKTVLYIIAALFTFNCVIPCVNGAVGRKVIDFYLPVNSVYAMYLLLGYYFQNRAKRDMPVIWCVIVIASCAAVFAVILLGEDSFKTFSELEWFAGYSSPITAVLTCAVFLLMRHFRTDGPIIKCVARNSMGIYLLHCFYIHVAHYLFGIPEKLYITPFLFAGVFLLSLATAAILRKNRFIREYVM